VFPGSPNISSSVSVGTPQRSPISPLLFLLYVPPLHMSIPRGLMVSYVDDFSLTVASISYRGNIRCLQRLFSTIAAKGRGIGVSFSVPKIELIHWRTPSQKTTLRTAAIELEGHLFQPSKVVSWPGYWFTPALTPTPHFRPRLSLAQAILSCFKHLSSSGAGVRPFLGHRIANGLPFSILTYRANLLTPNYAAPRGMNGFWHRVQRWTTNNLFSTPTSIRSRDACLPPIVSYCRYRRRRRGPLDRLRPPELQPSLGRTPAVMPVALLFQGPGLVEAPHARPLLCLPPP